MHDWVYCCLRIGYWICRVEVSRFKCGQAFRVSYGTVLQPFDVVRTRMQADAMHGTYRGTIGTLRLVAKEEGVRVLWKGTSATVIRLALGAGAHFFFLEQLKPIFATRSPDGTELRLSTAGAAATGMINAPPNLLRRAICHCSRRCEYPRNTCHWEVLGPLTAKHWVRCRQSVSTSELGVYALLQSCRPIHRRISARPFCIITPKCCSGG